jgi:transposase
MAYPMIMRERAMEALRNGYTKKEINKMYGLGINTIRSWERLVNQTGSLNKRHVIRKPHKIDREALLKYCKENPFATHKEAAAFFGCSERGIRHAKKSLKITRKKNNML